MDTNNFINSFIYYDSISDKIYWLGKDVVLSFVVKLSKKDDDGNRVHFHNEYIYDSKYINTQYGVSIKRQYDFYLVLESNQMDIYIQIRVQNMIILRSILSDVIKILTDDRYWLYKDNKLSVKGNIKPLIHNGLPMNKWLSFQPIPIITSNEEYKKGVRITLSDETKYIDVTMDNFLGFVYIINSIDMLGYAATLVNYIPNSEIYNVNSNYVPCNNCGTNNSPIQTQVGTPITSGKGRRIPGTQLSLEDMK